MSTITKAALADLFDFLLSCYPGMRIPNLQGSIEAYYKVLDKFDLATVKQAVDNHIEDSSYFPTAHDLRAGCVRIIREKEEAESIKNFASRHPDWQPSQGQLRKYLEVLGKAIGKAQ